MPARLTPLAVLLAADEFTSIDHANRIRGSCVVMENDQVAAILPLANCTT